MVYLVYIEKIFMSVSVFFDSLLLRFTQQRNLHHIMRCCIHSLFNAIISLSVGFMVSIVGLIIISLFTHTEILVNGITLFMLPLFLFVCFTGIILLNFRDSFFSLPNVLYVLYASIIFSQPRRRVLHALIFFLAICLVLGSIIMLAIVYMLVLKGNEISDRTIINTAVYSFSFSFVITSFLYSYGTADELTRTYRQFILWFSLLGG